MNKPVVLCGISPLNSKGEKVEVIKEEQEKFVKMLQDSDPEREYVYTDESIVKAIIATEVITKIVNDVQKG